MYTIKSRFKINKTLWQWISFLLLCHDYPWDKYLIYTWSFLPGCLWCSLNNLSKLSFCILKFCTLNFQGADQIFMPDQLSQLVRSHFSVSITAAVSSTLENLFLPHLIESSGVWFLVWLMACSVSVHLCNSSFVLASLFPPLILQYHHYISCYLIHSIHFSPYCMPHPFYLSYLNVSTINSCLHFATAIAAAFPPAYCSGFVNVMELCSRP